MTQARTFERERFAVSALIASTAVLCVGGALSQFLPLPETAAALVRVVLVLAFAGLCGFSLWAANAAAACAQILAEHRAAKPWAFGIALATAALTGLVSVIGVDLAWLALIGEQQALPATGWIIGAGFALGFVKVAMGFVIEACERLVAVEVRAGDEVLAARERRIRELEREAQTAARRVRELEAAPRVAAPARALERPPVRPRSKIARTAASVAASALILAGAGGAGPAMATPSSAPHEPTMSHQKAARLNSEARAAARARIAAGEAPHAVAKSTGISPSTCRRWASELGA